MSAKTNDLIPITKSSLIKAGYLLYDNVWKRGFDFVYRYKGRWIFNDKKQVFLISEIQ